MELFCAGKVKTTELNNYAKQVVLK